MNKLPTAKSHCTIYIAGMPVVSYGRTPGFIASPMCIPWQLLEDLFPGECVGTGYNTITVEEIEPSVFRKSSDLEISFGRRVGPNHVDYANPTTTFEGRWESIEDYRKAAA